MALDWHMPCGIGGRRRDSTCGQLNGQRGDALSRHSTWFDLRPMNLDPLRLENFLKVGQHLRRVAHLPGLHALLQAVGGEHAGRFPDVPLRRVQAVTAVGDVRGPDVLARRQQVLHPLRDQGSQRDPIR